MPFYLKKSVSVGPVRFNFSKSGVGTSVGVKGMRFGVGPRGSYVHMGRGGIYYRKTFSSGKSRSRGRHTPARDFHPTVRTPPDIVYDSAPVDALADESSAELVADINRRKSTIPWLYYLVLIGVLLSIPTCTLTTLTQAGGTLAAANRPTSNVIDAVTYTVQRGDQLHLIAEAHGLEDEELIRFNAITDPDRIEVGQELIITPARTAVIERSSAQDEERRQAAIAMTVANGVFTLIAVLFLLLLPIVWLRQRIQRTTMLLYDLEPEVEALFEQLYSAVDALNGCSATWNVDTSTSTGRQWKQHAGAEHLITRKRIRVKTAAPPYIKTNVSTPVLPAGRQRLFFLPDRLFILDGHHYAAIAYENIHLELGTTRFIEEPKSKPRDGTQVDTTWKHPNKSGGPDRRYKSNYQLPVMAYGILHFQSDTGLNELFYTSRVDVLEPIAQAIAALGNLALPTLELDEA